MGSESRRDVTSDILCVEISSVMKMHLVLVYSWYTGTQHRI